MTLTHLLLTGIVISLCVVIAYAKGVKDGKEDQKEESERKHRFTASRQRHLLIWGGAHGRN